MKGSIEHVDYCERLVEQSTSAILGEFVRTLNPLRISSRSTCTNTIADYSTSFLVSVCHLPKPCSFCPSYYTCEVIPLFLLRTALPTTVMSVLGGADCSAAANPLSQFSKHLNEDQSLQRDRLTEYASNGRQERFRSQKYESNQDEVNIPVRICHVVSSYFKKDAVNDSFS